MKVGPAKGAVPDNWAFLMWKKMKVNPFGTNSGSY